MWRKRPDPFPSGCGLGTRLYSTRYTVEPESVDSPGMRPVDSPGMRPIHVHVYM